MFFLSFWVAGQDSATYSIGINLYYHPQDFFFQVHGQRSRKNTVQDAFLGFGINKTIFQKQIRPVIGYDLGYCFNVTDWFSLTPYLRVSYSFLNTKDSGHPLIQTTESFLAGKLLFGKRDKIGLNAGIGPAFEWKYDAYLQRRTHFFMWNYFFGIAYVHTF